jgi:hypothetical protein
MRWVDGWMEGWMDGWMDGWMNGWMNGMGDGWVDGWYGITYISQYMRQTRWLLPFPPRLISASVFSVFLAEVQEDFVVGEERGLGGFDLSILLANGGRMTL